MLLERTEIEAFLTLSEELHFGRAAERLGLTTGRVSQTIKKLERRVGAPLFERSSRSVGLTPLGRRLVEDLAPLVAGIDEAVRRATDAGRGVTGVLRAGFLGAASGQMLLRAIPVFTERHPGCEVLINELQVHDAVPRLLGGEVDLVIGAFPAGGVETGLVVGEVLLEERRVLVAPAVPPWTEMSSVRMAVLAEQPVIQLPVDVPAAWRDDRTPVRTPGDLPVPKGPTARTFPEVLTLVAAGQGVFTAGEHARSFYPRPDVVYLPFEDAEPVRWGPVWQAANDTARVRAFARAAADASYWQVT